MEAATWKMPLVRPGDPTPHWDWIDVTAVGDPGHQYVRGPCRHLETVPVENCITGAVIARLCLACRSRIALTLENA